MAEGSWEVAVAEARAGGADERSLAFERLTAGRLERAYRLASAVLEDDAEAQDAVHDAGLRAWARWSELRDPARFDAWFDRIVVNACRDRQGGDADCGQSPSTGWPTVPRPTRWRRAPNAMRCGGPSPP